MSRENEGFAVEELKQAVVARRLTSLAVVLAFVIIATASPSPKITSLTAKADGEGTITTDLDKKKISAVLVTLKEDGSAQISLFSDMQLLVEGTWSQSGNQTVDLKITGGIVSGSATGSGKLLLRKDNSIKKLSLRVKSSNNGVVTVEFVAASPVDKP
ncbi:MAG TPA: hypothetical protein VI306_02035 [Pyrinomonadaceae bacterium]